MQIQGGGQRAVTWLAARQLAVVTFVQLQLAGLGRGAIAARLAHGSLHRRHRGVYLVGSPLPLPGASELAAVFACGGGALVSHRSAAALWGLLPGNAHAVDVTVSADHRHVDRVCVAW